MNATTRSIGTICLLLFAGIFFNSCQLFNQSTSKQPAKKNVVGKVAGEAVTVSELRMQYQSSSPMKNVQAKDLAEFLPLYLNYKAKLKAARDAGYYQDPELKKEFRNYARQAAYSHWMSQVIIDSLINELKRRRDTFITASHILIRLTPQASPSDTQQAYNKLMQARREYLNGAPFDSLVKAYSSKRRGRPLGGEIKYLTAGKTVKAFEDAVFNLPTDSVSKPVRTKYGYHLILVKEKRERKPDRKLAHIYFSTRRKKSIDNARQKAKQAYKALQEGMKWDNAVKKFTEDKASVDRGGQIGWINYNPRLDPAFVDSIMAVDPSVPYTEPIKSKYGYHIMRIDSIRTFTSDKQLRSYLMERLKKLPRYKQRKELVHQKIEDLGNAETHYQNLSDFVDFLNRKDTLAFSKLELPDTLASKTAYSINDQQYTVQEFKAWLAKHHGDTPVNKYRAKWFHDYKLTAVTEHLVPLTKKRFPEFGKQIQNYMDGLAVFQITQDSVWEYAQKDTARLKKIYRAHPDSFRYDKRYHYHFFLGKTDSLLQKGLRAFSQGMPIDTIEKRFEGITIRNDSTSYVEDFPFSELKQLDPTEFSNLLKYKNRKGYLYLKDILPPRRMTFEEAYNRLVSFYQPIREKEWIQALRKRYNVKMYPERLNRLLSKTGKTTQ